MLFATAFAGCGHCKNMKPEYSAAASELKKEALLAAMDVNKPQNQDMRAQFNISGFPTLYYFRDGKFLFPYVTPQKCAFYFFKVRFFIFQGI